MTFQARTHHTSYAAPVATKVNADRPRETAEIVLFPMQRGLPPAALEFADAARDMINAVFGAQSRHQTCINAARALGVSDDTVSRILGRETRKIEAELLFRCLGMYQARFGKPFAFGGGVGVAIVTTGGAQ